MGILVEETKDNKMNDCIFCKIVKGEFDSAKVWENEEFIAILDVMPNTKGMTLILTKKHYDSYVFEMHEDLYLRLMSASKKVAKMLEKSLEVTRVALVMEGMGVNHAHIKLYPLHGLKNKFEEMWAPEKVFFEKYEGFISTQTWPKEDMNKLKLLADEIKH